MMLSEKTLSCQQIAKPIIPTEHGSREVIPLWDKMRDFLFSYSAFQTLRFHPVSPFITWAFYSSLTWRLTTRFHRPVPTNSLNMLLYFVIYVVHV